MVFSGGMASGVGLGVVYTLCSGGWLAPE
ncbi:hypothetical protein LOK49_LG13G00211 [Camellia lanceoleosa]|uniref:Uncharacterized protein n=1 Tax=Camellia lanceoleosa TaxID=1840588 RepID=A0ACC0FHP9_9ERIC|nr:hypothetical protein LOK49_LG13G00211 [Camellia lanceoleosa]